MGVYVMPSFLLHAGTTPIRLATSKTRHIILPEDGPIGLKHVGVNDEIL